MATNSGNYGVMAPAAIDPFPIESVLAKIVGENNIGNAQNLLGQYHVQQQTSEGNYNYNLQQQHEFARQQLASQIAENRVKNMLDANKTAGGLPLMQAMGQTPGIDPALLTHINTGLEQAQGAKTFSEATSGLEHAVNAGYPSSSEQAAQLTGGMVGPQGTPLSTQNAQIAANARLAAARIRGSSTPGPSQSIKVMTPRGEASYTYPGKMTQAQVDADLDAKGVPRINTGGTPAPLPVEAQAPATPGTGGGSPNTSAPPPAAKGMTPAPQNEVAGKAEYQSTVAGNIEKYKNHPGYADIKQGMQKNGGLALVAPDGKGGWRPQGASGKVY